MNNWPRQRFVEVADGIVAVLNGEGEMGVANAIFVVEDTRAFVIDTMIFPEMAQEMAQEITRRGAKVAAVLNTHHHIDHIGGNKYFASAPIFGQADSIQALRNSTMPLQAFDKLMPRFSGRFANLELVHPQPIVKPLEPPRGGELLVFSAAHTVCDTAVWFPESRTLVTGDLNFIGVTPLALNGLISGWIDALATLLELEPQVVIPGHGPVGSAQDLLVLRAYLRAVLATGQMAAQEGLTVRDALASFDAGPVSEWLESYRTQINVERAMQEAFGEISRTDLSAVPPGMRE